MGDDMEIELLAKSSSGDPYHVRFRSDEGKLSISCTCQAGKFRKLCKHVVALLGGDASMLYDRAQATQLAGLREWAQGRRLASLFSELNAARIAAEEANSQFKKAKTKVEKAMRGGFEDYMRAES